MNIRIHEHDDSQFAFIFLPIPEYAAESITFC